MEEKSLLLTILVGLFFLIGIAVPKFFKNKKKLILFTTSLTLVIMLYLLLFDLVPEVLEVYEEFSKVFYLFIFLASIIFGFGILKILDFFVPEHTHNHQEENDNVQEHQDHLFHIGFITSISLIIHNMLEGISIYITGLNDIKLGLLMALSVGCHNLPLGIEVSIGLEANKEKRKQKIGILIFLVFSSFLGAFLLYGIGGSLNSFIEGFLLSMTIGMLLYISLMELLPEAKANFKEKETKVGFLVGLILAILLYFL